MANPSKSLNCQIGWANLLPSLGIEVPSVVVLPQFLHCPICNRDHFVAADDQTLGGVWTSCRGCGFAGDLIELAARVWDVTPEAAIIRLDERGFFPDPISDDDVGAYVRDHVAYRRRIKEFWERSRRVPMQQANVSVRNLLRKFGLLSATTDPSWLDRAGRFVGCASRQEAEELFAPLSFDCRERVNHNGHKSTRRGGGPGGRRVFQGHGWEDVLVVPYYDLPDRICGFLFVGRNADPEGGDFVYKRANLGWSSCRVREAGVAMLSSLDDGPDKHFGDAVFVITDPVVGLLLQTQRMRESAKAFPLVLAHFSPQFQTLRLPPALEGRKLIFWGEHPQLIFHAKRHKGLVSRYPISHREVARRLNHRHALDWLRLIQKNAVPWMVAFRRELRQRDLDSARRLVTRMEFTSDEMRDLLRGVGPELEDRFQQCNPYRLGRQRVIVAGKTIVETDKGWEIEGTGEQICNMPLRVEKVITTDDGDCFYRCNALGSGGDALFVVRKQDVDKRGLFACAWDHLLNENVGIFNYQPTWVKHAAYIAMQMHPPEFVSGEGRIGWSPTDRSFRFPRFSIGRDINDDALPLALTDDLPARHLERPAGLCHRVLCPLSAESPEIAIVWAVMACVGHNLIAAARNRTPCGIILDGEATAATGREAARVLGCAEVDIDQRSRGQTPLQVINERCTRHDWPAVIRPPSRQRPAISAEWMEDPGVRNAILSLNGYGALAVASYGSFFRIHAAEATGPIGELRRAIAELIPEWLLDICQRKLRFWPAAEHDVFHVLNDIAEWFERIGGDSAAVQGARAVLSVDSLSPWVSLVGTVVRMYALGEINVTRSGFETSKRRLPAVVYGGADENDGPTVWVPARVINQILVERRLPALDLASIERSLRKENAWLGQHVYGGVNGWLISQKWWDEKVVEFRLRDGFNDRRAALQSDTFV